MVIEYLKAEHACEDGIEYSHSSNSIEHEGTSTLYLDQKHLHKKKLTCTIKTYGFFLVHVALTAKTENITRVSPTTTVAMSPCFTPAAAKNSVL